MDFEALRQAVVEGNTDEVVRGVQALLLQGAQPGEILNQALIPGMTEVGVRFQDGVYFIPEMMLAANAMRQAMVVMEPLLVGSSVEPIGRVALGTISGDIHEFGKNLVGMMLKGAGFEVVDLGVDVTPQAFVAAADGVDVLGISALLSTTMLNIPLVLKALADAGMRNRVKVIVGGSPITQQFADRIGADAYAPDAVSAVACVKRLVGVV